MVVADSVEDKARRTSMYAMVEEMPTRTTLRTATKKRTGAGDSGVVTPTSHSMPKPTSPATIALTRYLK